ncbi:hypothetical protein BJV77DRAFT_268633 [Russula vinacea]|nr:hypothetical protein BJV77DRAFT_268633 [Russula vinacea]
MKQSLSHDPLRRLIQRVAVWADTQRGRRQLSGPRSYFTRLTSSHRSSPTDASPRGAVAAALQDTPPTATLSHSMEGTTQRDIVAPCTEPDIAETLSTASLPAPAPAPTPTLVPVPASTPLLIKSLEPCNAGAASISNPFSPLRLYPSPPLFHRSVSHCCPMRSPLPFSATRLLSFNRQRHNAAPTCSWTDEYREYVLCECCNAIACSFSSVLGPIWELGDLKRQRGAGVPDGGTPLMDATLKFFQEFMFRRSSRRKNPRNRMQGEDEGR